MLKYAYMSARAALESLGTDEQGLTPAEAAARLQKYGCNSIERTTKTNIFTLFLSQFGDVMTLLLVAAAAISGAVAFISRDFSDLTDTIIIIAIIALNAVVGTVQQYRADKAIESLKKLSTPTAVAVRGGTAIKIPAAERAPGALISREEPHNCRLLFKSRRICADGRIDRSIQSRRRYKRHKDAAGRHI